jgi:colanic acid biosynthesis glycosyl transferase WcaI
MRILLLNQFFWPDSAATSQLLTDLARHLAEEGHEVFAVCADGNYAVQDSGSRPNVTIQRVKALPFGRGKVGRLLSYLSFYVMAAFNSLKLPRPDLVLTLTTPPLLSLLGTLLKLTRGSRHFIWEMDVYPDVAVDLGYFKAGGMTERVTGLLADYSRDRADGVIALGECMKDRLMSRGLAALKIHVADNWADGYEITPHTRPGDPNKLVLLYSGNLGLAHDVETVTGSILQLRNDPRFEFIFVGSGGRRAELAAFCASEKLDSVEFRPYVQRANLGESLGIGDIGLVTQRDACCGSVVPSKVYGLLAAGRPVLFVGPKDATPSLIVQRFACGWQIDCGDSDGLTKLLLHLADHKEEIVQAAERARAALLDHYDLPIGVARIAGILGLRSSTTTLKQVEGKSQLQQDVELVGHS